MDWATRMTSSTVLLTRRKNWMRMSARMLSRQISPSRPVREISSVFTEMSRVSALCSTGRTTCPVKVTSTERTLETISALPCSTLRNRRVTTSSRAIRISRTAAPAAPTPQVMAFTSGLTGSRGRASARPGGYGVRPCPPDGRCAVPGGARRGAAVKSCACPRCPVLPQLVVAREVPGVVGTGQEFRGVPGARGGAAPHRRHRRSGGRDACVRAWIRSYGWCGCGGVVRAVSAGQGRMRGSSAASKGATQKNSPATS